MAEQICRVKSAARSSAGISSVLVNPTQACMNRTLPVHDIVQHVAAVHIFENETNVLRIFIVFDQPTNVLLP